MNVQDNVFLETLHPFDFVKRLFYSRFVLQELMGLAERSKQYKCQSFNVLMF
jgi:hypothetical protein